MLGKHVDESHVIICPYCNIRLKNLTKMKLHIEREHNKNKTTEKDTTIYQCDLCGESRSSIKSVQNHMMCVHLLSDNNGMYNCDECSYKCSSKTEMWRHFKEKHNLLNEDEEDEDGMCLGECKASRTLEDELKSVQSNFKRLEALQVATKAEADRLKAEMEKSEIVHNQKISTLIEENTSLKEKNDILYKLGEEYLRNNEKKGRNIM